MPPHIEAASFYIVLSVIPLLAVIRNGYPATNVRRNARTS